MKILNKITEYSLKVLLTLGALQMADASDRPLQTANATQPKILVIGAHPNEPPIVGQDVGPDRAAFRNNPTVHFLDQLGDEVYAGAAPTLAPYRCQFHQVDFHNPEQWNGFLASNGPFETVVIDWLVDKHLARYGLPQNIANVLQPSMLRNPSMLYLPVYVSRLPYDERAPAVDTMEESLSNVTFSGDMIIGKLRPVRGYSQPEVVRQCTIIRFNTVVEKYFKLFSEAGFVFLSDTRPTSTGVFQTKGVIDRNPPTTVLGFLQGNPFYAQYLVADQLPFAILGFTKKKQREPRERKAN
jgi:hypothetical protein